MWEITRENPDRGVPAFKLTCILSIGAQSAGCRFNKKPQYRYSGCHAYDTSALNIVLGLHFNFDDTYYVHKERETYFNKIQPEEITEEYLMITRQNNATETNARSLISERWNTFDLNLL